LAADVAHARTDEARVSAVEAVMSALHVDVLDPKTGHVIVRGAARSYADAYLYSSEIELIAFAYEKRTRYSLDQVARMLNDAAYRTLRIPLTAATLGNALHDVVSRDDGSQYTDRVALRPRLIRQLGLLHRPSQDLAQKTAPGRISLDALQMTLVVIDLTYPLIYGNPVPMRATSNIVYATRGVIARSGYAASPSCERFERLKESIAEMGEIFRAIVSTSNEHVGRVIEGARRIIGALMDVVHGAITGVGVVITQSGNTHTYLGGPQMHFSITVTMVFKLPQVLIDCGWLADLKFPQQGPIPDVAVSWGDESLVPFGEQVESRETDEAGRATDTFTPIEDPRKSGPLVSDSGFVTAIPTVNISLGDLLGFLGDLVRIRSFLWIIDHHSRDFSLEYYASIHDSGSCSGCPLYGGTGNYGATHNADLTGTARGSAFLSNGAVLSPLLGSYRVTHYRYHYDDSYRDGVCQSGQRDTGYDTERGLRAPPGPITVTSLDYSVPKRFISIDLQLTDPNGNPGAETVKTTGVVTKGCVGTFTSIVKENNIYDLVNEAHQLLGFQQTSSGWRISGFEINPNWHHPGVQDPLASVKWLYNGPAASSGSYHEHLKFEESFLLYEI
jgi:hypothetical protein